jgi:hypothetical protein
MEEVRETWARLRPFLLSFPANLKHISLATITAILLFNQIQIVTKLAKNLK